MVVAWLGLVNLCFHWLRANTPDEAMSGGLAKACVPRKKLFCSRENRVLIEYQTEWEVYMQNVRNLPRWYCCRTCCRFGVGGIRDIGGVLWTNVCTYHKVCAPHQYGQQEEGEGGPVGGLMGVGVVGLLEGLHCKVGDTKRRWSHMWGS